MLQIKNMKQKRATVHTILYNSNSKVVTTEVEVGVEYSAPDDTSIFEGTLEEFKQQIDQKNEYTYPDFEIDTIG